MVEDSRWMETGYVDANVSRDPYRYSIPRAMSDGLSNVSPGVAVSVEEKVSDLIQSYPHLKAFLKSHAKDEGARIRDLAIPSQERDQLLLQIIAARRQQLQASGATGAAPGANRSPQFRAHFQRSRRRKAPEARPRGFSTSSPIGTVTGKWHKRLWG